MRPWIKLLIIVVTLIPLVQLLVYASVFLLSSSFPAAREHWIFDTRPVDFIWLPIMSIVYIAHLVKTFRFEWWLKLILSIGLILGSMFVMPVYWYLFIWRTDFATSSRS